MKNYLILLSLLFLSSFTSSPPYNPSINIQSNLDGLVKFQIANAGAKTHIFMLYGDGTFGNNNVQHKFDINSSGYTTEAYFARPYKPNLPSIRSVNTGPVLTTTSTYTNPVQSFSGKIDIMTSWAVASNYENFFIVAFKNDFSASPVDGCIEFHYHNSEVNVNSPGIKEYNSWVFNRTFSASAMTDHNKKIKWEFSGLAFNETRYIYVPALVTIASGNKLNLTAKLNVNCEQGDDNNGSGSSFLVRRYPHDPNFKIVNRDCIIPNNDSQRYEYTVGFFNDGNDFAQNVFVTDVLDNRFIHPSATLIDFKNDPPTLFELNSDTLNIEFHDIFLPGTTQTIPQAYSYDQASTYFTFSICTRPRIFVDNCIKNSADIVFDTQPKFTTSPALICDNQECGVEFCHEYLYNNNPNIPIQFSKIDKEDFKVFPNPFENDINISFDLNGEICFEYDVEILNLSGEKIRIWHYYNNDLDKVNRKLSIGDLPKGIYFLVIKTNESIHIEKIIK